ncbi:biotin--[acetyl-CoA-carboxylase] ligase [Haloplasma contractile]|uniref:BirA bifunctional protein n=1 Tax=Haloplasma contractile SSD-17B TaxID=1033810 RepID=U2E8D9_9MOLU|nr:biotin--[acetyl-CoA-carboxylase] ligase [Haloplasma contractile]ERJ11443.1 BirA bifunctional protein [Haloplasma contractile SSD-17B]
MNKTVSGNYFTSIIEFSKIDSTNNYMKENFMSLPNFSVVRADYQTMGRGQFTRTWESNEGENLLMSILLKDDLHFEYMDYINPIIIASLTDTLKEYGIASVFKYPNDIYVNGKKICGVLVETSIVNNQLNYIVVGIGLNVNQAEFENQNATSIRKLTTKKVVLKDVMNSLLNQINHHINLALTGHYEKITETYKTTYNKKNFNV